MTERKLIEQKDWKYYVYEVESDIELSVPIPKPTPGFDVVYVLNAIEKENYLNTGIKTLENRIKDMETNFLNYKMNSWR